MCKHLLYDILLNQFQKIQVVAKGNMIHQIILKQSYF